MHWMGRWRLEDKSYKRKTFFWVEVRHCIRNVISTKDEVVWP